MQWSEKMWLRVDVLGKKAPWLDFRILFVCRKLVRRSLSMRENNLERQLDRVIGR